MDKNNKDKIGAVKKILGTALAYMLLPRHGYQIQHPILYAVLEGLGKHVAQKKSLASQK